mmetsp:Transcript_58548/g.171297  ORF Transcript_58548/g.171297 Transcript_58548/m.171297 type:complete len:324 (+) Transcript_58548:200-1171(+)
MAVQRKTAQDGHGHPSEEGSRTHAREPRPAMGRVVLGAQQVADPTAAGRLDIGVATAPEDEDGAALALGEALVDGANLVHQPLAAPHRLLAPIQRRPLVGVVAAESGQVRTAQLGELLCTHGRVCLQGGRGHAVVRQPDLVQRARKGILHLNVRVRMDVEPLVRRKAQDLEPERIPIASAKLQVLQQFQGVGATWCCHLSDLRPPVHVEGGDLVITYGELGLVSVRIHERSDVQTLEVDRLLWDPEGWADPNLCLAPDSFVALGISAKLEGLDRLVYVLDLCCSVALTEDAVDASHRPAPPRGTQGSHRRSCLATAVIWAARA